MPRLPIVGGDDGNWGTYLNAFLEVSLDNTNVDEAQRGKLIPAAVDAAGAVMNTDATTASMSFVVDEDNMASDSATKVPTQQSVKAYVDTSDSAKVTGPGSSTDNAIARFDSTTGKIIQNSGVTIDDSNNISTSGTVDGRDLSVDGTKLDGIEALADVTDATNVASAGAVMEADTTTAAMAFVVDEDNMVSNSATKIPTQQSVSEFTRNMLAYSASEIGLGFRARNPKYDDWITKYQAQLATPTPSTPLKILTIGDSISSATTPTFTGQRPWPTLLNILSSQGEVDGVLGAASGWLYAQPVAGVRGMTSTQGTVTAAATGGYGSILTTGQYATQLMFANYLIVQWCRTSGGGSIEVRDGSVGGTLLTTISTAGTTKAGQQTQITLTPNFFGRYSGTLYFVASGGTVVLEGVHIRSSTPTAAVFNAAHPGYTTANITSSPTIVFDFAETNQPDLTIVLVGVNDGPSNIESRMRTLIEGLQAVNPNNLIVLLGCYVSGLSLTFTNAMSYIVKNLADEYGCLFIDLDTTYPRFASTLSGDGLHPSYNGHRAIAAVLEGVLAANPLGISYDTSISASTYRPSVSAQWALAHMTTQDALDYQAANIMWRAGTPEGQLTAGIGSIARDTTNGLAYVKASGTGNTGWVQIPTISSADTLTNKTLTSPVLNTGVSGTAIVDEDDMISNSATKIPTQQSTKAYVDNNLGTPSIEKAFTLNSGGFSAIRTAINDSKNTAYDLVILGDSLPMHTFNAPGWTWQLGDKFARAARHVNPTKEVYYARPYYSGTIGHYKMDYCEGTDNTAVTARGGATLSNGQVAYHTAVCDGWTVGYTAGTGSLVVRDGGPSGTTLTTINTSLVSGSGNLWTSGALTYQSNQIHITSTGDTVLDFVRPYVGNRTSGVRVWTVARTGQTSSQFSATPAYGLNLINKLQPDFVLICTGTNDTGSTPVTTLIADVLTNAPSATVYGWVPPVGGAFTQAEADAIRTAYDNAGIAKIDMDKMLPDWQLELTRDGVHPYASTTRLMADLVWGVLTGDKEAEKMRSGIDNYVNSLDIIGTYNRDIRLLSARQASEEGFTGKPTIQLNDGATSTVTLHATGTTLAVTGAATVSGTTTSTGAFTASANAVINGTITGTAIVDEDAMTSNSATKVPTQQSVKAYVDSGTVTMTNKTLTAPVINNPTGFLTGAAKITVAASPPASPSTGDIWIDTA